MSQFNTKKQLQSLSVTPRTSHQQPKGVDMSKANLGSASSSSSNKTSLLSDGISSQSLLQGSTHLNGVKTPRVTTTTTTTTTPTATQSSSSSSPAHMNASSDAQKKLLARIQARVATSPPKQQTNTAPLFSPPARTTTTTTVTRATDVTPPTPSKNNAVNSKSSTNSSASSAASSDSSTSSSEASIPPAHVLRTVVDVASAESTALAISPSKLLNKTLLRPHPPPIPLPSYSHLDDAPDNIDDEDLLKTVADMIDTNVSNISTDDTPMVLVPTPSTTPVKTITEDDKMDVSESNNENVVDHEGNVNMHESTAASEAESKPEEEEKDNEKGDDSKSDSDDDDNNTVLTQKEILCQTPLAETGEIEPASDSEDEELYAIEDDFDYKHAKKPCSHRCNDKAGCKHACCKHTHNYERIQEWHKRKDDKANKRAAEKQEQKDKKKAEKAKSKKKAKADELEKIKRTREEKTEMLTQDDDNMDVETDKKEPEKSAEKEKEEEKEEEEVQIVKSSSKKRKRSASPQPPAKTTLTAPPVTTTSSTATTADISSTTTTTTTTTKKKEDVNHMQIDNPSVVSLPKPSSPSSSRFSNPSHFTVVELPHEDTLSDEIREQDQKRRRLESFSSFNMLHFIPGLTAVEQQQQQQPSSSSSSVMNMSTMVNSSNGFLSPLSTHIDNKFYQLLVRTTFSKDVYSLATEYASSFSIQDSFFSDLFTQTEIISALQIDYHRHANVGALTKPLLDSIFKATTPEDEKRRQNLVTVCANHYQHNDMLLLLAKKDLCLFRMVFDAIKRYSFAPYPMGDVYYRLGRYILDTHETVKVLIGEEKSKMKQKLRVRMRNKFAKETKQIKSNLKSTKAKKKSLKEENEKLKAELRQLSDFKPSSSSKAKKAKEEEKEDTSTKTKTATKKKSEKTTEKDDEKSEKKEKEKEKKKEETEKDEKKATKEKKKESDDTSSKSKKEPKKDEEKAVVEKKEKSKEKSKKKKQSSEQKDKKTEEKTKKKAGGDGVYKTTEAQRAANKKWRDKKKAELEAAKAAAAGGGAESAISTDNKATSTLSDSPSSETKTKSKDDSDDDKKEPSTKNEKEKKKEKTKKTKNEKKQQQQQENGDDKKDKKSSKKSASSKDSPPSPTQKPLNVSVSSLEAKYKDALSFIPDVILFGFAAQPNHKARTRFINNLFDTSDILFSDYIPNCTAGDSLPVFEAWRQKNLLLTELFIEIFLEIYPVDVCDKLFIQLSRLYHIMPLVFRTSFLNIFFYGAAGFNTEYASKMKKEGEAALQLFYCDIDHYWNDDDFLPTCKPTADFSLAALVPPKPKSTNTNDNDDMYDDDDDDNNGDSERKKKEEGWNAVRFGQLGRSSIIDPKRKEIYATYLAKKKKLVLQEEESTHAIPPCYYNSDHILSTLSYMEPITSGKPNVTAHIGVSVYLFGNAIKKLILASVSQEDNTAIPPYLARLYGQLEEEQFVEEVQASSMMPHLNSVKSDPDLHRPFLSNMEWCIYAIRKQGHMPLPGTPEANVEEVFSFPPRDDNIYGLSETMVETWMESMILYTEAETHLDLLCDDKNLYSWMMKDAVITSKKKKKQAEEEEELSETSPELKTPLDSIEKWSKSDNISDVLTFFAGDCGILTNYVPLRLAIYSVMKGDKKVTEAAKKKIIAKDFEDLKGKVEWE